MLSLTLPFVAENDDASFEYFTQCAAPIKSLINAMYSKVKCLSTSEILEQCEQSYAWTSSPKVICSMKVINLKAVDVESFAHYIPTIFLRSLLNELSRY